MTSSRPLLLRMCNALIRVSAQCVPADARDEWEREWRAEVWHRWDQLGTQRRLGFFSQLDLLRKTFGAVTHALWLGRRVWRPGTMLHDLRYAVRHLVKRPVFTVIVLASLALSIGANTIVFSIVDAVILNPYPYPDARRLVVLGASFPQLDARENFFEVFAQQEYEQIRDEARTLDRMVAFDLGNRDLAGIDAPERLFTAFMWGDAFRALDMRPHLGRGFLADEVAQSARVAVISYRIWLTRFGADSSVVGRTVTVNGLPRTVVGVMPPRMLLLGTDLWIPMWQSDRPLPRRHRPFNVVTRLRDEHTLRDANAELATIAGRIEQEHRSEFGEYEDWRIVAATMANAFTRTSAPAAMIVLGAVGLVLLIACANIANLLLARGVARQRELAVRTALGAGRRRLFQQLLTESAILALLGGFLGLGLAVAGLNGAIALVPTNFIPSGADIGVNTRVLLYTSLLVVASGVAFGVLPAVQGSCGDVQETLNIESGRSTIGRRHLVLRRFFVVAQVAVALVLLAASGLLLRSFVNLRGVDPGIQIDDVLVFRVTLPGERYQGAQFHHFFDQLVERVVRIPSVERAGVTSQFPPTQSFDIQFHIEGAQQNLDGVLPNADITSVSPDLLAVQGRAIRRGRFLSDADMAGAPPVAVINEAMAQRYFPAADPIGRRIRLGDDGSGPLLTVVGVVSNAPNNGLDAPVRPEFFVAHAQSGSNQMFVLARTRGDPLQVLPDVREAVRSLDPELPIYAIQTMRDVYADAFASRRVAMVVLIVLGVVALGLASVGVYGIMSYAVTERTREIGLRVALGAGRTRVIALVVRQAMTLVAVGVVVGVMLAVAFSSFLRSILYRVNATDLPTLTLATVALVAVALMAGYVPARRAARLDPMHALRDE